MNRRRAIMLKKRPRLPLQYQEVEYLESTGEQFIDTGVNTTEMNCCKIKFKGNSFAGVMCGVLGGTNGRTLGFSTQNDGCLSFRYATVSGTFYHRIQLSDTYEVIASFKNRNFSLNVDNVTVFSDIGSYNIETLNLYLFARNNNLTANAFVSAKIYYVKFYNDNIMVREFAPCYRKADNKPGLYDLVNGVFYTNSNSSATSDFITGPIVM